MRLVGYPIIHKVFIHSNGGFSRPDLLDPPSTVINVAGSSSADLESLPFSKVVHTSEGVLKQGEKKTQKFLWGNLRPGPRLMEVWGIFIFRDPRFGDIPPKLDLYNWHNWPCEWWYVSARGIGFSKATPGLHFIPN